MDTYEFEREFDIEFNNIMSNAAPSIDAYEKSVFLTKAEEEIAISLYTGSFELTENATEYLSVLVCTEQFDSNAAISIDASKKISANSKFFKLAEDALFITYEAIELKKANDCGEKVEIRVKPAKQDEYHNVSKNPFRRPRTREALRFNTEDMLEVVSTYPDYIYKVRYMRKPKPIVLYDQEGLTINGVCHRTECELDSSLHRKILERAVQLAALAYKQ